MELSIIIINLNGLSFLKQTLKSIEAISIKDYELIFFDNGSSDGSAEYLESFKNTHADLKIHIHLSPKNYGIAGAKQRAAKIARGKYMWMIDSDITFDADVPTKLVHYLEAHPEVALCGPYLENHLKNIRPFSVFLGNFGVLQKSPTHKIIEMEVTGFPVLFIPGAIMFVRRSDFEELGGFDDYLLSSEDSELGLKCWRRGFVVHMLTKVKAVHLGEWVDLADSTRLANRLRLNTIHLSRQIIEYIPGWKAPFLLSLFLFWNFAFISWNALRVSSWQVFLASFKGSFELLTLVPTYLVRRKKLLKKSGPVHPIPLKLFP